MAGSLLFPILLSFIAIASALAAVLGYRAATRRTMDKLDAMLDAAISGRFSERIFDESVLSALEAKLSRFLTKNSVSSDNLLAEKNNIKTLIADISHQTKTPVANILLYAQLLEEQQLDGEGADCVKALAEQAEKLNFLVGSLVKLSRLETGIITVRPRTEQVQLLLDAATGQAGPKAKAKRIRLQLHPAACTASFDLTWTTEAVYNILDNAVKYTPEGGCIQVTVTSLEFFCRIDITDNGIGIRESEHAQIFTRFYRSPSVSSQDGVGIGLYLAREILSAQGGYIKVKSVPGEGSVFSVYLPGAA